VIDENCKAKEYLLFDYLGTITGYNLQKPTKLHNIQPGVDILQVTCDGHRRKNRDQMGDCGKNGTK